MKSSVRLEQVRQKEQAILDAAKNMGERNRLGQYATPPQLALEIVQQVYEYWEGDKELSISLNPDLVRARFILLYARWSLKI